MGAIQHSEAVTNLQSNQRDVYSNLQKLGVPEPQALATASGTLTTDQALSVLKRADPSLTGDDALEWAKAASDGAAKRALLNEGEKRIADGSATTADLEAIIGPISNAPRYEFDPERAYYVGDTSRGQTTVNGGLIGGGAVYVDYGDTAHTIFNGNFDDEVGAAYKAFADGGRSLKDNNYESYKYFAFDSVAFLDKVRYVDTASNLFLLGGGVATGFKAGVEGVERALATASAGAERFTSDLVRSLGQKLRNRSEKVPDFSGPTGPARQIAERYEGSGVLHGLEATLKANVSVSEKQKQVIQALESGFNQARPETRFQAYDAIEKSIQTVAPHFELPPGPVDQFGHLLKSQRELTTVLNNGTVVMTDGAGNVLFVYKP